EQRTDSGLWSVSMTELGMDSLATIKDLRELGMAGSGVTGRWLEKLKPLQKLERLNLQDAKRLNDDAVASLQAFPNLRVLDLKGSAISEKAVAQLRQAMPRCQVIY